MYNKHKLFKYNTSINSMNYNKKGNIAMDTIFWVICTLAYFLIGFPIFNSIIDTMIEDGVVEGTIYLFIANVGPLIPIVGLLVMAWRSTQTEEDTSGLSSLIDR